MDRRDLTWEERSIRRRLEKGKEEKKECMGGKECNRREEGNRIRIGEW